MRSVTKSDARAKEWHVRRQRPDARTSIFWFIDADAERMSVARVLDDLAAEPRFRSYFLASVLETDVRSFVLEVPLSKPSSEFECALTELPTPKKVKVDPSAYASHFSDGRSVAVLPSSDGDGHLVVPRAEQVEGWYADLATFLRRIRDEQQHALLEAVARTARDALRAQPVCLRSSAPGAPWLSIRVGIRPQGFAYARYAR